MLKLASATRMAAIGAALGLALCAPPAFAGTAGENRPNGGVHFTAFDGEGTNRVTITAIPGGFRIHDAEHPIGSGCANDDPDPNTATCRGTRLEVNLEDGNDVLVITAAAAGGTEVFGGTGNDNVTASPSVDVVDG